MSDATILSLATGVPEHHFTQETVLQHYLAVQGADQRRGRAVRVIFERAGIGGRYFAASADDHIQTRTTQERNDIYMRAAVPLGIDTVARALAGAGLTAQDVDDFISILPPIVQKLRDMSPLYKKTSKIKCAT